MAELYGTKNKIRVCTACALCAKRNNTVPGYGSPFAPIVAIGEAPGEKEDLQGLPFVGASGKLLGRWISNIGFDRESVFITNTVKCRPPKNRDPKIEEINACSPFLVEQINAISPAVILTLGRHAANTIVGTVKPMYVHRKEGGTYTGIPVICTYHPAYILRNGGRGEDKVREDFIRAVRV